MLSSGEVYDPAVNEWTLITNMNSPRSGVQLVDYQNQYLFAIGGNDGIARQTSVERYDPKSHKWTLMANMSIPRSNFASAVLENRIYVIGGFNVCLVLKINSISWFWSLFKGSTTIAEVESYNPVTNSWQEMWKMNQHKSALSACIVSELENRKVYTWLRREIFDNTSKVDSNRSQTRRHVNTVPNL